MHMICILSQYSAEKQRVRDGLTVLKNYSWLLDAFVLDFYTEKHWEKLPTKWRDAFDNAELEELGTLLDCRNVNSGRLKRVWPLSFLALRSAAHSLSMSREQIVNLNTLFCETNEYVEHNKILLSSNSKNNIVSNSLCISNSGKGTSNNEFLVNPKFSHVFIKHVKPKKRHEVALMAKITARTANATGCKYVVDVGSGLGHLARVLAYGYNLQVCCLEAQSSLAEQARKLDLELEITLAKYATDEKNVKSFRPVHMNLTLNSSTDETSVIQALKTAFGEVNDHFSFGIVGLHPCGDLGPILLQLLIKCPNARFINIVGCCYMKITTSSESNAIESKGYPLSNFISQQSCYLSYEAREIACHAIENYCERLYSGDFSHLKIHCYRAILERILVKFWPNLRRSGIRSIRHASNLQFDKYCHAATARLGVTIPEEEIHNEETQRNLNQWKRVVIFYSLRLLLAPLVETILLFDRLFYLLELGLNGKLIPVFDPSLSPRNHILIATKQIDKQQVYTKSSM